MEGFKRTFEGAGHRFLCGDSQCHRCPSNPDNSGRRSQFRFTFLFIILVLDLGFQLSKRDIKNGFSCSLLKQKLSHQKFCIFIEGQLRRILKS